ncbi:MAG: TonB-dependent receptor plug domain-containing protein, partial [Gemmatimonadaceae bacterium]|nr:TonB-dependent receptor plug domain-containing protein [Gemmatimonadaceae bacterium]
AGRARWMAALAAVAALGASAGAQGTTASVSGTVTDSTGLPVSGAEVGALGTTLRVRSGEQGAYVLPGVALGAILLEARRLGFRPETLRVVVAEGGASARFVLRLAPTLLQTVAVRGNRRRYVGRLAGYYERLQSRAIGYFITRDDIERGNPRQLTDVLRRAPGVDIVRGGRVRLRGRSCAPLVWIDGVAMPAGEVDLNTFAPNSIEGVEVYLSASGAPARYQGTGDESRCGTLLLWSRGLDTERRRAPVVAAADQMDSLHLAGAVFAATEVETEARPTDANVAALVYPPDLYSAGLGGLVVAEFVVDTTGRMEPDQFAVLSSPHVLMSRAVYEALGGATFVPARRAGLAVRQIVQMRFRFAAPGMR